MAYNEIENPICQLCGHTLRRERIDEMKNTGNVIIYYYCKTLLEPKTDTKDAVWCSGRDHILTKQEIVVPPTI